MSKLGFDPSELQQGAKGLHHTSVSSKHSSKTDPDEKASLSQLEELYNQYDGDLDKIFEELGANPEKAKKPHNRPRDGAEFAEKFYKGFYSLVEDEDIAEAKSHK
mmetsp:Transcript_1282/g.1294  ORF Transcript_1282/g.1294 Transcript_1282/m.1294 type:complete len:105 (+) Transcript_1282:220-534(+)|eukprot:CAMPEP_0174817814 /NCGR_PEP_ID=MMETSP1107-20130205/367_1 /TAXON_ID=36770 /ORGANISM="Paraphysomonas vestita, Strain GFlagA" /LENGTH=104 /DNA_ID=CAMNT_0016028867 /DNA_START=50 /DNA_END=364 /DNA_ORIENTATION=-